MLHAESTILGNGRVNLRALEKHLPGIFVHCVEEPGQSLVLGRVEFPQIKSPSLTREDPAEEHDLDHVDKLDFLAYHVFNTVLVSGQLHQEGVCWAFGQRSRTVDLSGRLLPILSKVRELRSRIESNYEKRVSSKR